MSENPRLFKEYKKVLIYCGIHNLANFSRLRPYYDLCYGFDANPDKVAHARKVYEKDPYVKIVHGALTDKSGGEVEFTITTDWDPASSLGDPNPDYVHMKTGVLAAQKKIKVPTINLYDYCIDNGIDEIDTLITDLQGIDFTVLKTLTEFIKKGKIREIQCEVEPDESPTRYIGIPPSKLKDFNELLSGMYDLLWIDPLTPPEDAWEMDARWRVKGGTPPDGVEFILENDFLVAKGPSLLINVVYAHLADQEFFIVHRGNVSILWTPVPVNKCDLYAYHDAFSYKGKSDATDVLMMLEPMVVLPGEYDDKVWDRFDHILTLCDTLPVADKERFTKILFPRSGGRENKPITENIDDRNRLYPIVGRKSGICVISGNKQSSVPGEIYSKRFDTAQWFSEHSDYPFDIYGTPAFPLKNYLGRIPPEDKFKVLSQYRYCLCFENTNHPIYSRGYITEKILDCFEARTVPIYLGAENIEEYIPRDCFIDFRDFNNVDEFESFMKSIPEDKYMAYVRAIDEWVAAGNLRIFSWRPVYDRLVQLCAPNSVVFNSLYLRESAWASGFSPAHAGRQFKVDQLPQMWTWKYLADAVSPCLREKPEKTVTITKSTSQKVSAFHKKNRLKILYAGLKYNYGDARRGYDYGIWNMFDALHRFENIDVDLFDFVTEARMSGVAGMSSRLLDRVKKNKYDLLFYISFDKQADVLHDIMAHITNHTETVTAIWMSDDHWRFENYSSLWAPHTDYVITTSKEATGKYRAKGFGSKAIKSQWACNPFTYKPFPPARTRDISFVGMAHGNRPQIMEELASCGLKADVFGFGWNGSVDICFYDMLKIFNETRINLNLSNSSTITTQQIKGRNFEVPGCGGFLLTTPAEDLEECYTIDKEVVVASSMEEIIDKSRYYLAHDNEREAIARKAYERTLSEHTWMHRFTDIFAQMGFTAHPILPPISDRSSSFVALSPGAASSEKWFTSQDPVTRELLSQEEPDGLSSIIVIAYNQLEYTKQCVESILHYTSRPYELLLVDNGSTDGTYAYYKEVQRVHPHVRIIKAWSNRIVEGLFNHAASVAHGKYIVFTSNDTIVHENWLDNFIDQINAAKDIGIVGPRSNSISGPQLLSVGYTSLEEYHTTASRLSVENKGSSFQVQRMVGMTFITRKEILHRVGGMDIDLPTNGKDGGYGFSDDDMSVRFTTAGYKLVVADDVFIHHFGSVTILKDQPDAYGISQNINKVKFEKKLAENIRAKKKEDGTFFIDPLSLEDHIDVSERCTVMTPHICLAFINDNNEERSQRTIPDNSGYLTTTKSFSEQGFFDWLQSDEVRQYDYLVLAQKDTTREELSSLIETAICLPDVAILAPDVNEEDISGSERHAQDVKFVPLADLSVAVFNMKLAGIHLKVLKKFTEMDRGMLFLQRRLTGEGYFIAHTPAIRLKTEVDSPGLTPVELSPRVLESSELLRAEGPAPTGLPVEGAPRAPLIGQPVIDDLPENLLMRGNIEEARAIYMNDIEIDPSFTQSFYQLAVIALEKGDLAGAIEDLKRAMDSDENFLPAYLLSAKIAMMADNFDTAQSCLDLAFSKQPKNPDVVKAIDELNKRKNGTCVDAADTSATAPDEEIESIFAQTTLAVSQGCVDDACRLFEDFIKDHPDLGVGYAGYGSVLLGTGRFDKAKEVLKIAVSLLPSEIDSYLQLAQAQTFLNELPEAEKTIRAALTLDAGNAVALSRLADMLCDMDRPGDAIAEITDALQKNPADADLIAVFGGLSHRLGNMEALAMCLEKLIETDPNHTSIPYFQNILTSGGADVSSNLLPLDFPKESNLSLKPDFLQSMADIFSCEVFIETGTFMGNTTEAASKVFHDIHTIELSKELYENASTRFQTMPSVHLYCGDSASLLPEILRNLKGRALLWLDAHYSGGITAVSKTVTPVLEEIRVIRSSGIRDAVILIDDIREFPDPLQSRPSPSDYPTLDVLCKEIKTISDAYSFAVYGDILIAYQGAYFPFSNLVRACTISRLFNGNNYSDKDVMDAEDVIRSSTGKELSAINHLYHVLTDIESRAVHYRLWFALALMGQGHHQEALRDFADILTLGYSHWRIVYYLAQCFIAINRPDKALDTIKIIVDENPGNNIALELQKNILGKMQRGQLNGIDSPVPSVSNDPAEQQFLNDLERYDTLSSQHNQRFPLDRNALLPCLKERTDVLDFDRHYFFHTAWASSVLREINPSVHTDISSTMNFIAVISAFIPINYYEFRAPDIHLDNVKTGSADITALPFADGTIESLSCMHAVEHIGLGRYGDPIDPDGDLKAIAELQRVLKEDGDLLFVVPIGKPRLIFNAHRIYSYEQIASYFNRCALHEFALIPDRDLNGVSIVRHAPPELADQQNYGCGCFWFKKLPSTNNDLRQKNIADSHNKTAVTRPRQLTSIILYGADTSDVLEKCLASIEKRTAEPHEVLVEPSLQTIDNALKEASGKYIAILDRNTTVSDGWLTDMLACLESAPNAGLVGPLASGSTFDHYYPDFKHDENGLESFAASFRKRNAHRRAETMKISGSCMVFRKDLLEKTGMPDSSFSDPVLWGADFSILALLAGYDNFIAGDVFVLNNDFSRTTTNQDLFNAKWGSIPLDSPKGKRASALIAITRARGLHMKDKLSDAITALMDGIKSAPGEKDIYLFLASILLDAKLYDDVINTIESMPEISKETLEALSLAGQALEALNHDDKAAECVEKMLSQKPGFAPALNLKGLLSYKKGDKAEALNFFQQASSADPGYADPYRNMGLMEWTGDNKEGALDLFEKAFALGPLWMDNAVSFHTAAIECGVLERAEIILRDAVALYPQEKRIVFILIDVLLKEDKFEAAMTEIEQTMLMFGIDEGILNAALDVRKKVGPLYITGNETAGTLSVCMITKNEEKYIARCLASLTPVADEIIVVDTGSTDKTKAIAEAFGAQVSQIQWNNDFSEARNASLERAKGQWVLVHDGDEVISAQDHRALKKTISRKPKKPEAYTMITRNYTNNPNLEGWIANTGEYPAEEEGTGWVATRKVRLFTNRKDIRFRNKVHELLEFSLAKLGVEPKAYSIPVHHYGKLDTERLSKRAEMYYDMGKKKLESMQDIQALRELAVQAGELEKFEEAVSLWKQYIRFRPDECSIYVNISTCYLELGMFDEALESAKRAKELDPASKEAVLGYGAASICKGNITEGREILEELLQNQPGYYPAIGALAAAHCISDDPSKGIAILNEMRSKRVNYGKALHSLAKKLMRAGMTLHARRLLTHMIATGQTEPDSRQFLDELTVHDEKGDITS